MSQLLFNLVQKVMFPSGWTTILVVWLMMHTAGISAAIGCFLQSGVVGSIFPLSLGNKQKTFELQPTCWRWQTSTWVANGTNVNKLTAVVVILVPELTSWCVNVSPQNYFAAAPSLCLWFSTAQDICDWFKEVQKRRGVFSRVAESSCVEPD